jgi:hypothetical protein
MRPVTEHAKHLIKQRLFIVFVSYLIAFIVVGIKTNFQLQIAWLYLPLVIPFIIFAIIIPYLRNETIITGAVIEPKGDLNKVFRVIWVFFSGMILFIFIFGKYG